MPQEDPEAFLRRMVAPLSAARRGEPLPGVAFSREAMANAFVMLGLLPEARAEEILAQYRPELQAKGSWEFWFWPPAAKRVRVIVSTLWEAAWAELDMPGRLDG